MQYSATFEWFDGEKKQFMCKRCGKYHGNSGRESQALAQRCCAISSLDLRVETFEAKSKKTNEMDKFFEWILKENPTSKQISKPYSRKVDYLAQRYSDEELKAGLVNAYNAGEINHAKLFAAALGRQGFISIYQAERKVY